MLDSEDPLGLILWLRQRGIDLSGIDGGGEEHLVTPHDRAGRAVPSDFDFPRDVLFLAPLRWDIGVLSDAISRRSSKLRPVLVSENEGVREKKEKPFIVFSGRQDRTLLLSGARATQPLESRTGRAGKKCFHALRPGLRCIFECVLFDPQIELAPGLT